MAYHPSSSSLYISVAILAIVFLPSTSAAITSQFQNFYHQHGEKYEYILHHNCTKQFNNYLTGRPRDFPIDWIGGGGRASVLTQPVVLCILENTSEYIKSASSSAQVLLGITPTLLALLGASTDELAMLTVVARRPFLAFLLSIGSPSVYVSRAFEYHNPVEPLHDRKRRYHLFRPSSSWERWGIAIAQYVLALLAAANIATLDWELGIRTVCSFWTETVYAPLVWGILSVPIHIAGTLALRLRMRRTYRNADEQEHMSLAQWFRLMPRRLSAFCKSEWIPSTAQDDIRIKVFDEGKVYISWSWLLSTCTILHVLFGTLLLSSLLFIGPQDAVGVIVRYMASVLVCRVILMFEMAGMRERYQQDPADGGQVQVVKPDHQLLSKR